MKNKRFFTGILSLALVFGMTVMGCDNGSTDSDTESNGTGGGDGVGTVKVNNTSGYEMRNIKITRSGTQVASYSSLKSGSSRTFSSLSRGLLTLQFDWASAGDKPKHDFTLSAGEVVDITFTQYGNFMTNRSSGSNSGTDSGTGDTGSIKILNNSTYALYSVMISQNGKVVKNDSSPGVSNGGTKTYSGIPVGTCDLTVSRSGTTKLLRWKKSVTVSKGGTASVTITKTGWE